MSSYLKSAIDSLYSEDDDYIVLGLTGRTGSGCSTLASILTSEARDIKNSLYTGNNPSSNEERKQKIIHKCFESTWKKFTLIQVRSIITLLISDHDIPQRILSKIEKYRLNNDAIETIKINLDKIKERHNEFKNTDIKNQAKTNVMN